MPDEALVLNNKDQPLLILQPLKAYYWGGFVFIVSGFSLYVGIDVAI